MATSRPSLCLASVALVDIDFHPAWQAWHLALSTFTLRGRRGTYGTEAAIDFDCRAGNLHVLFWRCAQVWKMFSSGTSVLVCFGSSYTYTRTRIHAHNT